MPPALKYYDRHMRLWITFSTQEKMDYYLKRLKARDEALLKELKNKRS